MHKIVSTLPPHAEWDTGPFEETQALSQPYFYLGHGAQTYAFVSSDGQYVLKFYRHNRASHPLKFLSPLLPAPLKKSLLSTLNKRERKRLKDFNSYLVAHKLFQREAGFLYLHLNKGTQLGQTIRFYDKIGIEHVVEADQIEFILQRRAELIYPTLERWIAQGEVEKAKEGLTHLVELIATRLNRGIYDKDPDLSTNFGFIGTRAIQIDVGRFALSPTPLPKEELIRVTEPLAKWLEGAAPHLAEHLREEVGK
jgi:hypothetical protein